MSTTKLSRVEVRVRPGHADPRAASVQARARALGYAAGDVGVTQVYLLEGLDKKHLTVVIESLLVDPVYQNATIGKPTPAEGQIVEVHPLPGVMDPVAQSVRGAIRELTGLDVAVATGTRYDIEGLDADQATELAARFLANPAIHQITSEPYHPKTLPQGTEYEFQVRTIPLRGLSDEELETLSRESHLFMSLEELRAVADYFESIERDPTDIELETLAQTWSEHCVHKTLKSTVIYREESAETETDAETMPPPRPRSDGASRMGVNFEFTPTGAAKTGSSPRPSSPTPAPQDVSANGINWSKRPGHSLNDDGSITIDNLLKSTVAAATFELIADGLDWTLSVFKDNSGVIAFDDHHAVCIKVETHNHPSAIEPYGGAATGAGGCIRDVIGTGLGARPIANTDIFCVADPTMSDDALPLGALPPRRVLTNVVAGVRDYGNRMGIPTVNGAVDFDPRYVGNPLVFCGCVGILPRTLVKGAAVAGDHIIAMGGRTGRDGIHGATFSSAEMEHTHADEFSHAVQIGNPIEEKRVLDAIMLARDVDGGPLFHGLTDCGAGGFSSAIGEMGKDLGAEVHLDRAPLKYSGLSYTEIWISEAQERMVLAVPEENLEALAAICAEECVELADLGIFGTEDGALRLFYSGEPVGELPMSFLHDGLPMPTREAVWREPVAEETSESSPTRKSLASVSDALLSLLALPAIASKHWIVRQYDHEVQGATIIKPLVGPAGRGPSDAAVLEPVAGTNRGIALACGLQTSLGDPNRAGDPYQMALAAIDECVRNLICVGASPSRIAILDNFCWPSCDRPENMGALVRACAGCYDGAKAYRTPFVSGKDSLNNQLRYEDPQSGEQRTIEIPHTLLISGLGIVPSIKRCVTMDAKKSGNILILVGSTTGVLGGSSYQSLVSASDQSEGFAEISAEDWRTMPRVDLKAGPNAAKAVAQMISDGFVCSAHDCSEGGLLIAIAEMLIATSGDLPGFAPKPAAKSDSLLGSLLSNTPKRLHALGAELTMTDTLLEPPQLAFAESPSRYVLEIKSEDLARARTILRDFGGVMCTPLGKVTDSGRLVWGPGDVDLAVNDLAKAWLSPLDW